MCKQRYVMTEKLLIPMDVKEKVDAVVDALSSHFTAPPLNDGYRVIECSSAATPFVITPGVYAIVLDMPEQFAFHGGFVIGEVTPDTWAKITEDNDDLTNSRTSYAVAVPYYCEGILEEKFCILFGYERLAGEIDVKIMSIGEGMDASDYPVAKRMVNMLMVVFSTAPVDYEWHDGSNGAPAGNNVHVVH